MVLSLGICHPAGCRAPGNRAPSMHCQSGHQPGPRGWRYTHACFFFS
uniref:Uncharacterized protein n=1 Tax=Anguilla anguilla TaxID=7936 RepID=A0A0E9UKB4_ANGAN